MVDQIFVYLILNSVSIQLFSIRRKYPNKFVGTKIDNNFTRHKLPFLSIISHLMLIMIRF